MNDEWIRAALSRYERDERQDAQRAKEQRERWERLHMPLDRLRADPVQWAKARQDVADGRASLEQAACTTLEALTAGLLPKPLVRWLVVALLAHYGDPATQAAMDAATRAQLQQWKEDHPHDHPNDGAKPAR